MTARNGACGGALELHEHRVVLQVESEEDGVSGLQAMAREVALRLLWLDATEGGELRLALRDVHDGVCTLLTDAVSKQTANKGAFGVSAAADSRD